MKTKTTHTPGPWVIKMPHISTPGALGYLATVSHNPQALADARLIAAAPDLLVAIKEYLAAEGHAWVIDRIPDLPTNEPHILKIRAAIAKATGEGK